MNLSIPPFPMMTTLRLMLRRLSDLDENEIFALRSDPSVNRFIERPKPANLNDAAEFIKKVNQEIEEYRCLYWAISLTNHSKLIGTVCLWNFANHHTVAELGYEMFPAFQGRGLMQEAIRCVLPYGFENISLKRIEAFTHNENLNSIKLLKKNGFTLEPDRRDKDHLSNIIFSLSDVEYRKHLVG
jgi:ribosomal-protein-alanine N-acetyltransferase